MQRAVAEIKAASGHDVCYYAVDAGDEESIKALVARMEEDVQHVDILVNAQGINKKHNAEEFPMDVFKQLFDINVAGVMMCCKHFGQHMIKNGYGKIVNVSSVRGKIATQAPGNAGYCSTKGALDMLTRQLASEFGKHNITVNAIGPTLTETPMMTEILNSRGPNAPPRNCRQTPDEAHGSSQRLRRTCSISEFRGVLLCHRQHPLSPDGGLTAIG